MAWSHGMEAFARDVFAASLLETIDEPDNDLKEEEVMDALKYCGYQPEQLEFDFSEDAVGCTASSYEPQQPRCPLWKIIARLLLMPFALVYHIGLGIFCIFALPILLIGIVLRGLFRTFL